MRDDTIRAVVTRLRHREQRGHPGGEIRHRCVVDLAPVSGSLVAALARLSLLWVAILFGLVRAHGLVDALDQIRRKLRQIVGAHVFERVGRQPCIFHPIGMHGRRHDCLPAVAQDLDDRLAPDVPLA